MANLNEATETLCVSFLLPAAECDLNMTSSDKGLLTSMTFLGMLIGGYFWYFVCFFFPVISYRTIKFKKLKIGWFDCPVVNYSFT